MYPHICILYPFCIHIYFIKIIVFWNLIPLLGWKANLLDIRKPSWSGGGLNSRTSQCYAMLSHFSCVWLCVTHRRQPIRLPCPWDSPGKNTGVGCHFLLQCMKVKNENEVAQSCLTLRDPMDCNLPGSSIHGIFQKKSMGEAIKPHSPEMGLYRLHVESLKKKKKIQMNLFTK